MKAFILCAGMGKRLKPITEEIPKPLIPILGKPLIFYTLEKLKEISIKEIGINLHWLPEKIKNFLQNFKNDFNFHFFYEKELLDTGGALKNAKDFLKDDDFIVINGDIIFDFSLKELLKFHKENENSRTILITDNKKTNNLIVSKEGNLLSISKKFSKNYKTFCGIAIYKSEIFNLMEKEIFSIKKIWEKAIEKKLKIKTFFIEPDKWKECGNINSYIKTLLYYLKKKGEKNFINENLKIKKLKLEGFNIIEKNVKIKENLKLRNCILLSGAKIEENEKYKLIGKNFKIKISRSLFQDKTLSKDKFLTNFKKKKFLFLEKITVGGSLRNFYSSGKNFVFLESSKEDKEFERLIKLNNFFSFNNFPVPEVYKYSLKEKKAIFENCGEYSLYDLSKFLPVKKMEEFYKKVIEKVALLHNLKIKNDLYLNYVFDKEYFLWECNYFFENFLKNYLKIKEEYNFFKEDFEKLAEISSNFEKRILHRDLQSQNILIKKGKIKFIDYQSSRLGPPSYDISSLLWDPYFEISKDLRKVLINYYKDKMGKNLPEDFDESIKYTRCQRHFQALGAFSFLGLKRGKEHFLKFIEKGKKLLVYDLEELKDFKSFGFLIKIL